MNYKCVLHLADESETKAFAARLANALTPPLVIGFQGDIGAGKTTMIRAMLKALGVNSAIKSPTFAIVESYALSAFEVHHFDLYRVHHEEELDYIGFREYFSPHSICCIEWPSHAGRSLPVMDVVCALEGNELSRMLHLSAYTERGAIMLKNIAGES